MECEETVKNFKFYIIYSGNVVIIDEQFIGKKMRLLPVTVETFADIKPTLEFYMGRNTPSRKQFIMENLRCDE